MKRGWIHPMNVIKIAQALLQLDLSALQEKYKLDAQYFFYPLQKSFQYYVNPPTNEQEIKNWNRIDNIEYALKNLLIHVNTFINLLTPEVQQQLEQQFNSSP
jgi:hypothetical protein